MSFSFIYTEFVFLKIRLFKCYSVAYTKSKDQLDYLISVPRKGKLCTTGLDSLRCHQHKKAPVTTKKWLLVGWSQKQHILYCRERTNLPKLCQHDPMQNPFPTTNLMTNMILVMQGKKYKILCTLSKYWPIATTAGEPNNGQILIFQRQMGKINNQKVHAANCVLEDKQSSKPWKDQRKPLKNKTWESCVSFSKFQLTFVLYLWYTFP